MPNVSAFYLQRGEALDYTNAGTETIPAGTIVTMGTRIGVTGCDIKPGELGSVHVVGVFRVHKVDTTEIAQGTTVYFNGTGITATASGDTTVEMGYAASTAAAGDDTVLVKLHG